MIDSTESPVNTSNAPESSDHGPAMTSLPDACSSASTARWAGRAARRASDVNRSSTTIMGPTVGTTAEKALYHVILDHGLNGPTKDVDAGHVVAREGEPAQHLIVVEEGTLTATRDTARGQRLRLGEFAGPCAVDKTAVLDERGYTATWVAATRCKITLIPAHEFLKAIDDVPAVRRHVLKKLAGQVRAQQDDLVRANRDTATRAAAWLTGRGQRRVVLPGAQQGLAETLGSTRVSVNRALRKLAREGLIEVEPGAVVILAPELLALRAEL